MGSYSCTKLGRWLPTSHKSLRITTQFIELGNWKNHSLQLEKWSDVTSPPSLIHGWLLHTVRISLAGKRCALFCFLGRKAARSAWLDLSQGWYRPRIEATANVLSKFDSRIQRARYCRTSKWKSLTSNLQAWREGLPPMPAEGVLTDTQIEVLLSARALAEAPDAYLKGAREAYVAKALSENADLFETVESMPLTAKQREACIIDDDNNLVLAGAGTGKTSTIMGRVAYLIRSGQAKPEEILLLAFGNKAAAEMRERLEKRLGIKGIEASTFHALGQKILATVEGRKPSISPLAEDPKAKESFVNQEFQRLQSQPEYRELLLKYFTHWLYPEKNPFDFKSLGDYYRFLEDNEVRSLKGEKVKSFAECEIANFLFQMGIPYQYEATYQPIQRSVNHRAYKPDFYLPDHGIYIEHFGVDRDGNTAPYVDRKEYQDGMQWKRSVHKEQQTRLIETFHFEQQERQLLECLASRLTAAGVKFDPLPPEAILETLREFGAVSAFAAVLSDLLTLHKASFLTTPELESKIQAASHPEQMRCALELLRPITESYEALLGDDQIDFDDMIGKSLEYVESGKYHGNWRFVLVDEFQDISLPRAKLVRAIRNQQPDGLCIPVMVATNSSDCAPSEPQVLPS